MIMIKENILVMRGDITTLGIDAIVTNADPLLMGGEGIDAAIHRAAGKGMERECRAFRGCPRGQARITQGHKLTARFVIHAVGPLYVDGVSGEDELLRSSIRDSLKLAAQFGIHTIAFPTSGGGRGGFPIDEAAMIAVGVVREWMRENERPSAVIFCCVTEDAAQIYRSLVGSMDGL